MPLVNCPSCEKQISPAATACPQCGHPMRGEKALNTIQATAKRYKAAQLLGMILSLFGGVVLFMQVGVGEPSDLNAIAVVTAVGLLLWVYGRLGAWWNHS